MKRIITGENQFTTPIELPSDKGFSVSIRGSIVGTITLQRVRQNLTPDDSSDWADVAEYTSNIEDNGIDYGSHWYRIGIKTGDYTSGTGTVSIVY